MRTTIPVYTWLLMPRPCKVKSGLFVIVGALMLAFLVAGTWLAGVQTAAGAARPATCDNTHTNSSNVTHLGQHVHCSRCPGHVP
jgi:hypothetical protein